MSDESGIEYRVMYWSEYHGGWFSHTGQAMTKDPEIAAAWLEQATYRGGRSGPVDAFIEQREVGNWTRITDSEAAR